MFSWRTLGRRTSLISTNKRLGITGPLFDDSKQISEAAARWGLYRIQDSLYGLDLILDFLLHLSSCFLHSATYTWTFLDSLLGTFFPVTKDRFIYWTSFFPTAMATSFPNKKSSPDFILTLSTPEKNRSPSDSGHTMFTSTVLKHTHQLPNDTLVMPTARYSSQCKAGPTSPTSYFFLPLLAARIMVRELFRGCCWGLHAAFHRARNCVFLSFPLQHVDV